jgi:predicted regulator of Ras-like GTPase activity (Roadblock/LC7/MglB family)
MRTVHAETSFVLGGAFLCSETYPAAVSAKVGFRGGNGTLNSEHGDLSEIFASAEFDDTLEAVFLLKPTGVALASWTRARVPNEVIGVMAATVLGSVETITAVLGGPRVVSVSVETDRLRLLVRNVNSGAFLVLIAPRSTKVRALQREARRLVARIRPMLDSKVFAPKSVPSPSAAEL